MKNTIKNEVVKLTKKLITFRTTELYPQEKEACLEYIKTYFQRIGGIYIKKIINKDCNALLISNTKTSIPDLLLNGHIDVVEGDNTLFKAKEVGNKIYGRGAIDMKGSVAVMMVLMKKIVPEIKNKKIMIMIVADEEIPIGKSTDYLLNKFKLTPKFTIVGEETGFNIVTEQKGNLNLRIITIGKAAHSAFPKRGVNAIEKSLTFYKKIRGLNLFQIRGDYSNTIALTYLRGGQTINSIPDRCEMGINIRYIGRGDLKKILNFISEYQRKIADFSINIKYNDVMIRVFGISKDINRLKKIIKETLGINARIMKTATSSDAKFYSVRSLPVIVFGPRGANYHENKEYVEINSLVDYFKILDKLIKKL